MELDGGLDQRRGVGDGPPGRVKSFSACLTRSIVAGGTTVVDVVVGGVVEEVDWPEAVALASPARLGVGELLLGGGDLALGIADGRWRRR